MKRKIIWAPQALRDLRQIHEFISLDKPGAAALFCEGMIEKIEQLAHFPEIGRAIPELGQSRYRELIVEEYRIFHEVTKETVLIFRIMNSRQLF